MSLITAHGKISRSPSSLPQALSMAAGNITKSVIELSPASAAFIRQRVDTLGPWVLGSYSDCILMGVVFCQVRTFFATRSRERTMFQRYCYWLVWVVLSLSVLKVWVQNVHDFANPDVARTRVSTAWWQVSTPLMTGHFYLLSRNWLVVIPIVSAMTLGITGICLTVFYILTNNVELKVRWLLIHLIGVFIADFLITMGTFITLRRRASGLERTTILINRLVRMMFERSAFFVIATIDLIMTQTLGGPKLLWHLLLNFTLGKIYVISLLYTLNSINAYRRSHALSNNQEVITADGHTIVGMSDSRRHNLELGRFNTNAHTKTDRSQIFVQTQVSTHVSPTSPRGPIDIQGLDNKRLSDQIEDDSESGVKAY
ncbi:hypothetical protein C8F01DRAFT_1164830 [Mycena amicta]|nr:hypothetical protein C8F01DRAFT_1164830 [Mycena amicta]